MGVVLAKAPDGREYAYALIGIIEKRRAARHYYRWLRARGDVIREMSGMVYRIIAGMHGFAEAR
jgi:beta-lactamase class A